MFDNLFNYIIILVPIAIFIFRIIGNLRKQDNAPVSPVSGAGYEDDDEEEEEDDERIPFPQGPKQGLFPVVPAEKAPVVPPPVPAFPPVVPASQPALQEESPSRQKTTSPGALRVKPEQTRGFPYNLDYLAPLKRGVVLSEILGPPKGL
ncbi:MAG: hypothetical protein LBC62_01345 [Treponema sp.]|jgi:hypothetical protein|nr:hypothetical protein [Treponema sp.]